MIENFKYWLFTSYRRKQLDRDLFNVSKYFKGKILDVGGGHERGKFQSKRNLNWTIADIDKKFEPDVVCGVENMPFKNNSFDIVKATELFGYVQDPTLGLKECIRVLKKGGYIIASFPFLTPVDIEQHDSQRLSEYWIKDNLKKLNCKLVRFKTQGVFLMVISDFLKWWISRWFLPFRILAYFLFLPLIELLVWIDGMETIQNNSFFRRFPSGYFVVVRKK